MEFSRPELPTGVGNVSFLQGVFPTQGLNPGLPHCGQILYQLSHKGSHSRQEVGTIAILTFIDDETVKKRG